MGLYRFHGKRMEGLQNHVIMRIFLLLLLPLFSFGQNTTFAVSDSIHVGLVGAVNDTLAPASDTLVQSIQAFYANGGRLYLSVAQIAGGQFRAVSDAVETNVFKFNDPTLIRAWHLYEIDNWLTGATGTNYGGYSFTGAGPYTCTLTVSAHTWTGSASTQTDALGLAFYHFLIDPSLSTYLQ